MNTIPIDIYYKNKQKSDIPTEITYVDAIEVIHRYNDKALSRLLYDAVVKAIKTNEARANKVGRFVWNINIDLE